MPFKVPYTAKAQKYVDNYEAKREIPYAQEGCASPGLPIAMRTSLPPRPGLIASTYR
jgi:hypothetical protein